MHLARGRPNYEVQVVGLFGERIEWHRPFVSPQQRYEITADYIC